MCKYFLKGSCKFGSKCALMHNPGDRNQRQRKNSQQMLNGMEILPLNFQLQQPSIPGYNATHINEYPVPPFIPPQSQQFQQQLPMGVLSVDSMVGSWLPGPTQSVFPSNAVAPFHAAPLVPMNSSYSFIGQNFQENLQPTLFHSHPGGLPPRHGVNEDLGDYYDKYYDSLASPSTLPPPVGIDKVISAKSPHISSKMAPVSPTTPKVSEIDIPSKGLLATNVASSFPELNTEQGESIASTGGSVLLQTQSIVNGNSLRPRQLSISPAAVASSLPNYIRPRSWKPNTLVELQESELDEEDLIPSSLDDLLTPEELASKKLKRSSSTNVYSTLRIAESWQPSTLLTGVSSSSPNLLEVSGLGQRGMSMPDRKEVFAASFLHNDHESPKTRERKDSFYENGKEKYDDETEDENFFKMDGLGGEPLPSIYSGFNHTSIVNNSYLTSSNDLNPNMFSNSKNLVGELSNGRNEPVSLLNLRFSFVHSRCQASVALARPVDTSMVLTALRVLDLSCTLFIPLPNTQVYILSNI